MKTADRHKFDKSISKTPVTRGLAPEDMGRQDCIKEKLDGQVKSLFEEGKPLTVWKVAAKSGDDYAEYIAAVLDRLTTEGILAKFRVGFNNYYALPKVALTGEEPTLRTLISDSMKNWFPSLRHKVTSRSE